MTYSNASALVQADWLEAHIDNPTIAVIDATWHMPNVDRNALSEYNESHLPGAIFFDIDAVSDGNSDLPHMLPSAEEFAKSVGKMGISNEDHIVIYDSYGLFSAARVWWMFKAFGHENVSLLNGGSLQWAAENRPMTDQKTIKPSQEYSATLNTDMVKSLDQVLKNLDEQVFQVIDARARDRFNAEVAEPRPGLRSGHIPSSLNLPFNLLLNEDKTVKSEDEIQALFADEKLDFDKPVVTSCGTGVTACVLTYALHLIGKEDVAVYDGSWTEWGGHRDTPIEP